MRGASAAALKERLDFMLHVLGMRDASRVLAGDVLASQQTIQKKC